MDTTLILIGVACIIGAIIGGGVKLVQVELGQVSSLWRQSMLGIFGAVLIVSGLVAGGHLNLGAPASAVATEPRETGTPTAFATGTLPITSPVTAPTPQAIDVEPEPAAQATSPARSPEVAAVLPGKVDIFWCEDSDAQRAGAERVAPALRDTGEIGRVRVRPLPAATNTRSDYGIHADIVRFDPGERPAAEAIARLASRSSGRAFEAAPALPGSPSIGYLSVFVCGQS